MSLGSITERAPRAGPSTGKWVGGTIVALLLWGLVYSQLVPFSDWVVSLLPVDPKSHLGEALSFFVYDTPKVLMLLTLVVFAMGVVRSFFSPEKTRALLAGRREGVGNVLAAGLGILTPFCSCSAVPLFIGFVSAGVPLGVTFSFLIAAPMVNEVALGLLFALVGWKVALTYLAFGLAVAIVAAGSSAACSSKAGWKNGSATCARALSSCRRNRSPLLIASRPASKPCARSSARCGCGSSPASPSGAFIHGYVPAELLASIMGQGRLVVGAGRRPDRHSDVLECRRHHPGRRGAARQGRGARHRARLHDVGDRAVAAGDDHPAQGADA